MAMLRPSYSDLMNVVNSKVEEGEEPVINSRYSIVMATAKRARQIIAGDGNEEVTASRKPLSIAVEELAEGKIRITGDEEEEESEEAVKSAVDDELTESVSEADPEMCEAAEPSEGEEAAMSEAAEPSEGEEAAMGEAAEESEESTESE